MDPSTVIDEAYGKYREQEATIARYEDKFSRICIQARELVDKYDQMTDADRLEMLNRILFENEMLSPAKGGA